MKAAICQLGNSFCVFDFSWEGRGVFRAIADNYVTKASREENKLRNSSCVTWILNENSGSNILFAYSRKSLSMSLSVYIAWGVGHA